jgi:hypothetical protein
MLTLIDSFIKITNSLLLLTSLAASLSAYPDIPEIQIDRYEAAARCTRADSPPPLSDLFDELNLNVSSLLILCGRDVSSLKILLKIQPHLSSSVQARSLSARRFETREAAFFFTSCARGFVGLKII